MPKFDKPDSPNIIWGVNALEEDLTKPSDSYIQTGWTQVKPPYEYENYSMNKLYQGFAYYNQLGIPEWDSVTEYQAGKSYAQGSNNLIYKCIQTHVNKNPSSAGNENYWEVFEGNRGATSASRGVVRIATSNQTSSLLPNESVPDITALASLFDIRDYNQTDTIKLPNSSSGGLIVKVGVFNVPLINQQRKDVNISFPTPFPKNQIITIVQKNSNVSGSDPLGYGGIFEAVINKTKSGFTYAVNMTDGEVTNTEYSYISLGY